MPDLNRQFAVDVVQRLTAAGFTALWAGGCVRDYLLGRTPKDYDVATDARPDDVRQLFGRRQTLAVGASFGVIIVRGPRGASNIEVATFRTEGPYLDGRRPEHVEFSSPREDAQRRDFTINGIFYDPLKEQVLDYVGGQHDLAAGIVRAIGNPRDRMAEDKLRMLRAVRFAATLEFDLDQATADAVRGMAAEMLIVSAERIAQELKRMLIDRHRRRAVQLAAEVGLLPVILPEVAAAVGAPDHPEWARLLTMLDCLESPGFELAAATLLHSVRADGRAADLLAAAGIVRDICWRLRLSNQETDHITWLIANQGRLNGAPRMTAAELKRLLAHPLIGDLLALTRVECLATGADPAPVNFCQNYLHDTSPEIINPPPLLTGDDLIAHGFRPGRHFKTILDVVRDAQLNDEIASLDEALELARRLADQNTKSK